MWMSLCVPMQKNKTAWHKFENSGITTFKFVLFACGDITDKEKNTKDKKQESW
jgi:hypothetical protein